MAQVTVDEKRNPSKVDPADMYVELVMRNSDYKKMIKLGNIEKLTDNEKNLMGTYKKEVSKMLMGGGMTMDQIYGAMAEKKYNLNVYVDKHLGIEILNKSIIDSVKKDEFFYDEKEGELVTMEYAFKNR